MQSGNERPRPPANLRGYFYLACKESFRRKPVSFYLIFAILVMLVAGSQIAFVRDDPYRFAFYLSLHFIFFFVVAGRAIVDFFDIARRHFRERENLFRSTLGDDEFVRRLGESVNQSQRSDESPSTK